MTIGSLFAGMGGFETGFSQAGFKVLWSVELEAAGRKVLKKHWTDSKLHGDRRPAFRIAKRCNPQRIIL